MKIIALCLFLFVGLTASAQTTKKEETTHKKVVRNIEGKLEILNKRLVGLKRQEERTINNMNMVKQGEPVNEGLLKKYEFGLIQTQRNIKKTEDKINQLKQL